MIIVLFLCIVGGFAIYCGIVRPFVQAVTNYADAQRTRRIEERAALYKAGRHNVGKRHA